MNTPPFASFLYVGNTSNICSLVEFFCAVNQISSWFLFSQHQDIEEFKVIQDVISRQVKYPYIINPESLVRCFRSKNLIDDINPLPIGDLYHQVLSLVQEGTKKEVTIHTRYTKNITKYCNLVNKLKLAIEQKQPRSNITFLQNEYISMRNEFRSEILHTSALCEWNKNMRTSYFPLMNSIYLQTTCTYKCENCSFQNHTFETASSLNIDCDINSKELTLEEILKKYSEIRKGTDKWICSICQASDYTYQNLIWKLPETLILNIKSSSPFKIPKSNLILTDVTHPLSTKIPWQYELVADIIQNSINDEYACVSKRKNKWFKYQNSEALEVTEQTVTESNFHKLLAYTLNHKQSNIESFFVS